MLSSIIFCLCRGPRSLVQNKDDNCLDDFWATKAALNTALLAYNLMSLFRQAVLRASVLESGGKDVQHTLKTLRYKLFTKAVHHDRRS